MVDYDDKTKKIMHLFFNSLPENQRRHYAAIESMKIGYRGVTYISKLLEIDRSTIHEGLKEIKNSHFLEQISTKKQRQRGGGRKKKL